MPYNPPPFAADDVEFITELQRLADGIERRETRRLARAIAETQGRVDLADLAAALRERDRARDVLLAAAAPTAISGAIGQSLIRTVNAAGPLAAAHARRRTGLEIEWPGAFPPPRGIFDSLIGQRLWGWLQGKQSGLLSHLTAEQAAVVDAHLTQVVAGKLDAQQAAELLQGVVGVTPAQAQRLFAWDATWRARVAAGEITPAQRLRLLAEARRNLALQHAALLVRQYTMQAINQAQRELMAEASRLHPFLGEQWFRESVSVGDGRVCPFCRERHGWRAPLDGRYEDGSEGPPWPHAGGLPIGCRCVERWAKEGEGEPGELPPMIRPRPTGRLEPAP